MSFSQQSGLVEVMEIFQFDAKEKKIPLGNEILSCPCPTFHRKERVELMYLLDPSGLTGLEPAASALTGRCSNQLNYNPREIRDIAENMIFFIPPYQVFRKDKGLYHLMVDWRIIGPSWI